MSLRTHKLWLGSCYNPGIMQFVHRAMGFWRRRSPRPRYALALAGGGVIGGMYEVGAMTALQERLNGSRRGFDVYVGCSAGSVVAGPLVRCIPASDVYPDLDGDLVCPLHTPR